MNIEMYSTKTNSLKELVNLFLIFPNLDIGE
jgi:hypothetical protein